MVPLRVGKKQIALKRQVSVPDNPVIVQAQHAIQARSPGINRDDEVMDKPQG
ncbi:hypothetical protein VQ030_004142 [Salmonella enterica]|nr:hypothetical protein [Salmonella enterica]